MEHQATAASQFYGSSTAGHASSGGEAAAHSHDGSGRRPQRPPLGVFGGAARGMKQVLSQLSTQVGVGVLLGRMFGVCGVLGCIVVLRWLQLGYYHHWVLLFTLNEADRMNPTGGLKGTRCGGAWVQLQRNGRSWCLELLRPAVVCVAVTLVTA